MALHSNLREVMTEREREEFDQQKIMFDLQAQYNKEIKDKELEIERLEAKWASWTRLPVFLIMLPVRMVMAFGYIVLAIRGKEPGDNFWKFMR